MKQVVMKIAMIQASSEAICQLMTPLEHPREKIGFHVEGKPYRPLQGWEKE